MKALAFAIALAALTIPISAASGLASPQTVAGAAPSPLSHVVGGLSVTLKQAAPVNGAVSDRRPVPPPAGRRWWRTIWHFHNVTHHMVTVQLPVANAGSIQDPAHYFGGAAPHYRVQPKMSVNIMWYFAIPRAAKSIWFRYGNEGTVLWFHAWLR